MRWAAAARAARTGLPATVGQASSRGGPLDVAVENLRGALPATRRPQRRVARRSRSGELVALLGPSGSGKTTLLRIIGGLDQPSGGRVLFGGEDALAPRRPGPQDRLRLPELRALPPYDGRRQHRLRPDGAAAPRRGRLPPKFAAGSAIFSTSSSFPASTGAIPPSSPAASASASRSPGRLPSSRASSSSTSPSAPSTRGSGKTSAAGSATFTTAPATPPSSSPTTRKRRSNSPTASPSSTTAGSSRSARRTKSTTGRRRPSSPASSARATRCR